MADCYFPTEDFETTLGRIVERTQKENWSLAYQGTIEVTPYCNMKCVHCYVTPGKNEGQVLSYTELCRIIDEMVEEGCFWLLLTGGEPFVRKDFLDIYTYAKKKGIFIAVFTNGTLITRDIARYLSELPPRLVEISLYGATKTTYEKVTGVPGSYERCLNGIELFLEYGIDVKIKTMLMNVNRHEYWDMKGLADRYGCKFRMDAMIHPDLDGSRHPCKFRLTPEEVAQIDVEDPERRKSLERLLNQPVSSQPLDTVFTCGAGMGRFHIDAFGKLQMCTIMREPAYDLRKGSFREGWRGFLRDFRARKLSRPSVCRTCQYRNVCDVCPGWAMLECGTMEEQPIEYLCEVNRMRAEKLRMITANNPAGPG